MRPYLYLVLLLAGCLCGVAQDDSASVANAARKARESKSRVQPTKRVVTDETIDVDRSPIPPLNLDGRDNAADIVKAIGDYKLKHTAEETEQAVRDWYTRYDRMMESASDQNAQIRSRQEDRRVQPRVYPDDYKQYQEQLLAEARSKVQDDRLLRQNGTLAGRIQQAFFRIKSDLFVKYHLNYEWLKPSAQYW